MPTYVINIAVLNHLRKYQHFARVELGQIDRMEALNAYHTFAERFEEGLWQVELSEWSAPVGTEIARNYSVPGDEK